MPITIDIENFSTKTSLENKSVLSKVFFREVDFSRNNLNKNKLPTPLVPADLCYWYVMPERHQAYSSFWFYATGLNVFANMLVWFYI
jgi:hypothetical protein